MEKFIPFLKNRILLLVGFVSFLITGWSQTQLTQQSSLAIYQFDDWITQLNNPAKELELKQLSHGLESSIYLSNGVRQLTDDTNPPTRVITDMNSLSMLYENDVNYAEIKIIIVKITSETELSFLLNLNEMGAFTQLQYIYFSCSCILCPNDPMPLSCEQSRIKSTITGEHTEHPTLVYTAGSIH
jgi:hypothetical protein